MLSKINTMKKLLIFILILLFLISCKENELPEEVKKGLIKNNKIIVQDEQREYHLFLPNDLKDCSVVFLLHGNGGSADDMIGETGVKAPYKVWLTLASQSNFIVVIPNGNKGTNNKRGWNDCREEATQNPTSDDLLFLDTLLETIQTTYKTNPKKVFVVGTSNGGHMAIRLAQEIPQKITAFAVIAAAMPYNSTCITSSIPISALFMNGTDDPILPYNGGQIAGNRGEVFSTAATINYWIERNETFDQPVFTDFMNSDIEDNCTIESYLYTNSATSTQTILYKTINGGHTEPSRVERYSNFFLTIVGNQNADVEMAEEIWKFFEEKSK